VWPLTLRLSLLPDMLLVSTLPTGFIAVPTNVSRVHEVMISPRWGSEPVLELELLQAFQLLDLQPAELLAPPISRSPRTPDLADRVRHGLTLRN
jgi:hypothetical protein